MHWYNSLESFCKNKEEICEEVEDFIRSNLKWIKKGVDDYSNTSEYWHQVYVGGCIVYHYRGQWPCDRDVTICGNVRR